MRIISTIQIFCLIERKKHQSRILMKNFNYIRRHHIFLMVSFHWDCSSGFCVKIIVIWNGWIDSAKKVLWMKLHLHNVHKHCGHISLLVSNRQLYIISSTESQFKSVGNIQWSTHFDKSAEWAIVGLIY